METRFYTIREKPPAYGGGDGSRKLTPGAHRSAIAAAAKELNDLRERWLNPPEWTVEKRRWNSPAQSWPLGTLR